MTASETVAFEPGVRYFEHYGSNGHVHAYRRGSVVALYNSVNLNTAFVRGADPGGGDPCRGLASEDRQRLRAMGLDLSEPFARTEETLGHLQERALDEGVTTVYFIPAMACNYRCHYCQFIQEFDDARNYAVMTSEQARSLVDEFYETASKVAPNKRDFVFFGGEPFMAPGDRDRGARVHPCRAW